MTRLVAFRLAALVAVALGLAACGVISTLVEGWKYARAVETDLESATGVKPLVGFKWENGRLLTVTVAYPQLYERKPLAALARDRAPLGRGPFQGEARGHRVVLFVGAIRLRHGGAGGTSKRRIASREPNSVISAKAGTRCWIPVFAMSGECVDTETP